LVIGLSLNDSRIFLGNHVQARVKTLFDASPADAGDIRLTGLEHGNLSDFLRNDTEGDVLIPWNPIAPVPVRGLQLQVRTNLLRMELIRAATDRFLIELIASYLLKIILGYDRAANGTVITEQGFLQWTTRVYLSLISVSFIISRKVCTNAKVD
jgi:hypothetical protein